MLPQDLAFMIGEDFEDVLDRGIYEGCPVLRLEPTVFAMDCHVGAWGMPQHMVAAGGGNHHTKTHPSSSNSSALASRSKEGGWEGGNSSAGGGTSSFLWGWLLGRSDD